MKFFDKKGREIKEYDVLKVFHYTNRRHKKCYMYKWVISVEGTLMGKHLTGWTDGGYWLKSAANKEGVLEDTEIVESRYYT